MTSIDLNNSETINNEISTIRAQLNQLNSRVKFDEISEDELYDEEPNDELEDKPNEELNLSEVKKEEKRFNYYDRYPLKDDNNVTKKTEPIDIINKNNNKTINLTKYIKRELKQYLSAFGVNINRLIKKYKNYDEVSEDDLVKIQTKYNSEYSYFNQKSSKLLNKLDKNNDLTDDEYDDINNKLSNIDKLYTSFINEFIDDSDNIDEPDDESDE